MKWVHLVTNTINTHLMKNTMLIPLVTVTWFLFGWWIYWAFPTGPGIAPSIMNESAALITDESTV